MTEQKTQALTVQRESKALTIKDIQDLFCPNSNDIEARLFIEWCGANAVDPYRKEAYLIKYDKNAAASMVLDYRQFMVKAEMNPNYRGFKAGIVIYNKETKALDYRQGTMLMDSEALVGGWCEVFRADHVLPNGEPIPVRSELQLKNMIGFGPWWKKNPALMIRKCGISAAFREAFPAELGAINIPEEFGRESGGAHIIDIDDTPDVQESLDVTAFDEAVDRIAHDTPRTGFFPSLGRFLAFTAEKNGCTTDEVKMNAQAQMPAFWAAFDDWAKEPAEPTNGPEGPETHDPAVDLDRSDLAVLKHLVEQNSSGHPKAWAIFSKYTGEKLGKSPSAILKGADKAAQSSLFDLPLSDGFRAALEA